MLRTGALLLILIVLLQAAGKWIVMADYALNNKFIATVLCENKNKTALHCNGRCHLRKQLQKENSGGEKGTTGNNQQHFQEVFFETYTSIPIQHPRQLQERPVARHPFLYTSSYIAPIFHPPGK